MRPRQTRWLAVSMAIGARQSMEPRRATLGQVMIAVYGATGYTGRLVAAELRRRGLTATLCGRSHDRLEGVVHGLDVDWPVRRRRSTMPGAAPALLGASVVINCAGPFTYYGAPVIEAALDVGAHYCDTTGEQPYMNACSGGSTSRRARAGGPSCRASGSTTCRRPGCALAAAGWSRLSLDVAYAVSRFGATRGTCTRRSRCCAAVTSSTSTGRCVRRSRADERDGPLPAAARRAGGRALSRRRGRHGAAARRHAGGPGMDHRAVVRAAPAAAPACRARRRS